MQTPDVGVQVVKNSALDAALARLGYRAFRPGQREAIEWLIETGRLLLVAPTGGGKSLSYQLPATLLPGTTLVVSPLISLMHDQVDALAARGVAATYLASTLPADELGQRMAALERGAFQLVYAAPERLVAGGLRALLQRIECPLIAIDEAHCISAWGHDFRPEYLALGDVIKALPKARVLACTATATPVVRDEILAQLGLDPETPQIVRGFARPNLALRALEVRGGKEAKNAVDALLDEALGGAKGVKPRGAAIVYAPTRRATEAEALRLGALGFRAAGYHAGLSGAQREAVSRDFASGALDLVVATNAFGMGIDRADVRAVVHLAPPGSIEAYYQEVGRAGRDGAPALGLMLLSPGDLAQRRALLERDAESESANPELLRHRWGQFLELMRWAEGGSCRHDSILRYFGDDAETLAGCGHCDVCSALDARGDGHDPEQVTLIVRKALSAVARIHGRFGLTAGVSLLRGKADARLERSGLHRTPTFGALSEYEEHWLARLLRRCVVAGFVELGGGERPTVTLTPTGRAVMRGEQPARLLLPGALTRPAIPVDRPERLSESAAGGGARSEGGALSDVERLLFDALRKYRLERSRAEGVPPYVVASDRTLREIAQQRPGSEAELEQVHGIGPSKRKRYGAGLLEIVRRQP